MNRFVLDASVAVAWVVGTPVDPYAVAVQSLWRAGGARSFLPCGSWK